MLRLDDDNAPIIISSSRMQTRTRNDESEALAQFDVAEGEVLAVGALETQLRAAYPTRKVATVIDEDIEQYPDGKGCHLICLGWKNSNSVTRRVVDEAEKCHDFSSWPRFETNERDPDGPTSVRLPGFDVPISLIGGFENRALA